MRTVIVIGGGAAGLMAAGRAAERGNRVLLLEKNEKVGKKLAITGKGRCNLTNDTPVETMIENLPGNPYFLYSALYAFDSQATKTFFNDRHVPTKTERGNRVFPVSDQSGDVVRALERYCTQHGVTIACRSAASAILTENNAIKAVRLRPVSGATAQVHPCDAVIVATGGLSYPATGSDGDGYRFAKTLGHTVTKLYPSLVPLKTAEEWVGQLQGLSLRNIAITVKEGQRVLYRDFGELLFTHYGLSGPVVLSASRALLGKQGAGCVVVIDLKPALDDKTLDKRLLRDFTQHQNKDFRHALDDLLPQKLIPVIVGLSGIDPVKKVNAVTKTERQALCRLFKALTLTVTGTAGFNEAVVTAGGVCVDEVDPGTMASKKISGLYFAGEVLDVDGYTGGFNLQIAFSTGYAAGSNV